MAVKLLENFDLPVGEIFDCDIFIYSSSYEARSKYLFNQICIQSVKEFVLPLADIGGLNSALVVIDDFKSYLDKQYENVRIVIDISCMPREMMAGLLAVVDFCSELSIELVVVYCLAGFTPPSQEAVINEEIEPVHKRFAGWSSPDTKPTSLILGLGYEPDRAEGASEFFEPSDQWVFVPKSPVLEFFNVVSDNNKDLLREVGGRHVIEYNVLDPALTFAQLEMVVGLLLDKTNPVLLPFGPKIFFFLCLIQCLYHPQLGVWHFSNKNNYVASHEVEASGDIAAIRCLFG